MEPHRGTTARARIATGVIGATFFVAIIVRFPGATVLVTSLLFAALLVVAAMRAKRRTRQNCLLALASVSFSLSMVEAGAWFPSHPPGEPRRTETLQAVDDPDLGYRPLPNQMVQVEETVGRRQLFRTEYRIDGNGLRWTPEPPAPNCRALFFSDSYTWGWGLPDDATLPAAFVAATGGRYAAVNYSFGGYGPHQMLRAIETDRIDRVLHGGRVDLVVYQGIVNHLGRAAGRGEWDLGGPKYFVDGEGKARYVGPFHGAAYRMLARTLRDRSQLYRFIEHGWIETGRPKAEDLPLYVAILKRVEAEVARHYGSRFIIVFWDTQLDAWSTIDDGSLARATLQQLRAAGLRPIAITSIIPDIDANRPAYAISDLDLHPNRAANERIAEELARTVAAQPCGSAAPGAVNQRADGSPTLP
jgi:hypothetical protein